MVSVFFSDVFLAKIVDNKGERDGASDVSPESRGVGNLVVAEGGESLP